MKICSVFGCFRKHSAKGLCAPHYARRQKGRVEKNPIRNGKNGANNPKWRGGSIVVDGRVLIYSPDHPYPNWGGKYVYRYRLVMEEKLGRFLLPGEIVHHKNEIQDDDIADNLKVTSQNEHVKIHHPKMMRARKEKAGY